jgi:PHP family Zn ribbon phosphoesterase
MDDFLAFMLIIGAFIIGMVLGSGKKPICPKCKTQFELGKSKRTPKQIWWSGGWTCQKCGAEIDRKGNLVKKKVKS